MGNTYEVCDRCGTRHKQCLPSQIEASGLEYIETPRQPARSQRLVIRPRLDGLNELIQANRTHWRTGNELKVANEALVRIGIIEGRLKPITKPFSMKILWLEQDDARDPDNILSAKKYILDALQQSKIITNDGQANLKGLTEQWDIAGEDEMPGVYIDLIEEQ